MQYLHGIHFTLRPIKRTSGSSQTLNFSPTFGAHGVLAQHLAGRII
jgi:hypothetical protein